MLFAQLPALLLAAMMLPSFAEAGMFYKGSPVKMLDTKSFKKAMRENQTSVVAFVAPWCGHCKNLVPEYEKAAKSFNSLVPLYAVDCDAEANKPLCSQHGVQGFPTVKLFPRGNQAPPAEYRGERTSKALFGWVMGQIPHGIKRVKTNKEITKWLEASDKPHVILLNKSSKIPLLWKVIANKYNHRMKFGNFHDEGGAYFESLGLENNSKSDNKLLFFAPGSTDPVLYEGVLKREELSEFIVSVIKGKADLTPKKKVVEVVTPVEETPVVEVPVVETPVVETPVVETPVAETPVAEVPVVETPVAEVPVVEVPVDDQVVLGIQSDGPEVRESPAEIPENTVVHEEL